MEGTFSIKKRKYKRKLNAIIDDLNNSAANNANNGKILPEEILNNAKENTSSANVRQLTNQKEWKVPSTNDGFTNTVFKDNTNSNFQNGNLLHPMMQIASQYNIPSEYNNQLMPEENNTRT